MTKLFVLLIFASILGSCENHKTDFTKLYHIPYAGNITIDGDLSDWKNRGLKIPLNTNRFGQMDTVNLLAFARLAWNEEYLYLMAEIQDDILHQDSNAPLWRNDGIEVFLSAKKGTNNFVQYLINPALTVDFPSPQHQKRNYISGETSFNTSELLVASKNTSNGYVIELAIPFSILQISPKTDDTLAFNFYINDSDGDRIHQKYSWHYNENTYLNHDAFHEVILAPRGQNRNMLTRAWLLDTMEYHVTLFSETAFDGHVKFINNNNILYESGFKESFGGYTVDISFHKELIDDLSKPLEVWFDDIRITHFQWMDMERQYVNIPQPNHFELEILAFEKTDIQTFPPLGATLFVGSSSIRLWRTLSEDLPGITYINRGFGGSSTSDVLHFFDRIVAPYHPSAIVFFTGTNDLASGVTPQKVTNNTEEFIKRASALFPDVQIFILSNTIAVSRKHLYAKYHEANRLIEKMLKKYNNAVLVDVTTPGLQDNGAPRPEIYTSDSLHLNRSGYKMWGETLRPFLLGSNAY